MPNYGLRIVKNKIKRVNNTTLTVDLIGASNRTFPSLFIHWVFYRQFSSNVYRKFIIDTWEDLCKAFKGGEGNPLTKLFINIIGRYSNFFQPCPYPPGTYYLKIDNMRSEMFNFGQLFPSGRFRMEFNITDSYQGRDLLIIKLYFSNSDLRVEQF